MTVGAVPGDMTDAVAAARTHLMEAVAESDEELFNAMLENGTLDDVQFGGGLRKAVGTRALFPVFAASGTSLAGAHQILGGPVG